MAHLASQAEAALNNAVNWTLGSKSAGTRAARHIRDFTQPTTRWTEGHSSQASYKHGNMTIEEIATMKSGASTAQETAGLQHWYLCPSIQTAVPQ